MQKKNIFIALGSSIGNAKEIFASTENYLMKHNIQIIKKSSIYQTKPFGGVAQNIFSNAVWEIKLKSHNYKKNTTIFCDQVEKKQTLNAELYNQKSKQNLVKEIFITLKECEIAHGRDLKAPRWSDRKLDLDILMVEDITADFEFDLKKIPALTTKNKKTIVHIPHPRISERDFVLNPWAEIVPDDFCIPKFGSIKNLIDSLE